MNESNKLRSEIDRLKKELEGVEKNNKKLADRVKTLELAVRKYKKQSRKIKSRLDNQENELLEGIENEIESSLEDLQEEVVEVDDKVETLSRDQFINQLRKDCLSKKTNNEQEIRESIKVAGRTFFYYSKIKYKNKKIERKKISTSYN